MYNGLQSNAVKLRIWKKRQKYTVPNGTLGKKMMRIFYQYQVPNGTKNALFLVYW
jgi:hypothetical protein